MPCYGLLNLEIIGHEHQGLLQGVLRCVENIVYDQPPLHLKIKC